MSQTIFEKIIAGEIPCAKVFEDDRVFAFMDAGQVNPGHVIVAARKPFETLLDADETTAVALFAAAYRMARAIDKVFSPAGMTILQSNKAAGWQTVPHLHLHVIPRSVNDGVTLSWPRSNPPLEELRRVAARLAPVREHASANSTQKPRSFAALLNAPPGASHDEIHLDPPRG